jgi:hypothetical protein
MRCSSDFSFGGVSYEEAEPRPPANEFAAPRT